MESWRPRSQSIAAYTSAGLASATHRSIPRVISPHQDRVCSGAGCRQGCLARQIDAIGEVGQYAFGGPNTAATSLGSISLTRFASRVLRNAAARYRRGGQWAREAGAAGGGP